jgi:hypothetical protein
VGYIQSSKQTKQITTTRPLRNLKDVECYHYGERGHYARDCMSERVRKLQRRDAHYLDCMIK